MESKKKILGCQTKKFKDGKNKLYYKSFSISDHLRKSPYLALREARKLRKNNNDIDFDFADINCSLEFRYKNGSFRYFNSQNELPNLINKYVIVSSLRSTDMVNVSVLMKVFQCF